VIAARWRGEAGQSSIEILGLLPLVTLVVLTVAQVLAGGAARSAASAAAEAGAMAIVQGGDPAAAARAAVPGWTHPRLAVRVSGRHVRVRVTPAALLPILPRKLATTAQADAGPAS
jgi:hypothetical protein